jgi:hypothetical protein
VDGRRLGFHGILHLGERARPGDVTCTARSFLIEEMEGLA